MRIRLVLLIVCAVLVLGACGPKVIVPVEPEATLPQDALFLEAQRLEEQGAYDQALEAYQRYRQLHEDDVQAAAAQLRIGKIYRLQQKPQEARETLHQLASADPDGPWTGEAMVEILGTFYDEGRYEEVLQQAAMLPKERLNDPQLARVYLLLADSHAAQGEAANAVVFYALAYDLLPDEEKMALLSPIKVAVRQLDASQVKAVQAQLGPQSIAASYLQYQLGASLAEEEAFDEAIAALTAFLGTYPHHEWIYDAENLIYQIHQRSLYDRYAIGCLLPLSGPYSAYGNRALKGIELALAQFAGQGSPSAVRLLVKDTAADPQQTVKAVTELHQAHVAAIIGPLVHPEAAAAEVQRFGIPMISLTQKEEVTALGDYIFRNFLTPQMQVQALVAYATETLGLSRFAILYPDEKYGYTFRNLFWDEVIAHGGRVVGLEAYNPGHTDFADPIKKMVGLYYPIPEDLKDQLMLNLAAETMTQPADDQAGVAHAGELSDAPEEPIPIVDFEAVFIPDAPRKAGLIVPQLAFYDVKDVYLLGTNLWHSEQMLRMAGEYAQGAILVDGFATEVESRIVQDFIQRYQNTYGQMPGFIEAISYDTANILFELVNRPEIQFRSALKRALMALRDFKGVTGTTGFEPSGEALKKPFLLRIKGDRFVQVNPTD